MLTRVAVVFSLRHAVAAIAALCLLAPPAAATQITVTTTQDETTADGDCSLREAFLAANTNGSRDACPAGSNSVTDEIVLAADAVYALTLSPAGNDNGFTGQLVALNGGATTDLKVSVAGDGAATISQDAPVDTRILTIASGASVLLEDVTLQGGSVTGGSERGGAISAGTGSRLGLTRCVVRENSSVASGGAIRTNGELVIEDSVLSGNSTQGSGGAISTGTGAKLVVGRTLFENNAALGAPFSSGGAIESSEPLSIVDSTFVNNVADGDGGAIVHFDDVADLSSIAQSCFVGNAGDFSGNAVDVFNGSKTLAAAGNWWGADSGPSGEGTGSGDGVGLRVEFDPPQPDPHPGCLPLEMAANGGFESDGDGNAIPDRWTGTLLGGKDQRACGDNGNCFFKIRGNGNLKRLQHVIAHSGSAGDAFTFRARSRAADVPSTGGAYRAVLRIIHSDGSRQTISLNFSTGKHGFERLSKEVTATEDYSELQVAVEYGKFGGLVRFDSVSLQLTQVP